MGENERPYVVGFIFSAQHGHAKGHMRTLNELADVRDIHVCAIAEGELEELAGMSSKVRTTTRSMDELLRRDDLDALVVCVRNDLGPGVLQAGLDAGLPSIFEKPVALSADHLRPVAEAARKKGITIGNFLQWRGQPEIQEIRQARIDGALGRVMAVEARMVTSQARYRRPSNWMFQKETAGSGILGWLGCHFLDMMIYTMGDTVVEVIAMCANQAGEKITVEDTALLVMKYASGTLGTLHTGYLLPKYPGSGGDDNFLALRGTEGYARLPLDGEGSRFDLLSVAPGWAAGGLRRRSFEPPQSPFYGGTSGEVFLLDFLNAARAGEPARSPIEAMVHVLEIIDAALQSSETGRAVRIEGPGMG